MEGGAHRNFFPMLNLIVRSMPEVRPVTYSDKRYSHQGIFPHVYAGMATVQPVEGAIFLQEFRSEITASNFQTRGLRDLAANFSTFIPKPQITSSTWPLTCLPPRIRCC